MKKIKQLIIALAFAFSFMPTVAFASPISGVAATGCIGGGGILTLPCWYRGLPTAGGKPTITKLDHIWVVALNVVEMLIQLAAYVALGYIIWGGFKYIKSQGEPGKLSEAKNAILQAVIGLGVALASVGIVNLVAGGIS